MDHNLTIDVSNRNRGGILYDRRSRKSNLSDIDRRLVKIKILKYKFSVLNINLDIEANEKTSSFSFLPYKSQLCTINFTKVTR